MSKKRKYIIIEVMGKFSPDAETTPVLFSDDFIHSSVARGIKSTFSGRSYSVVSAGFYRIDQNESGQPNVKCFGRSDSLDLDSREIDSEIIAKELGIKNYPKEASWVNCIQVGDVVYGGPNEKQTLHKRTIYSDGPRLSEQSSGDLKDEDKDRGIHINSKVHDPINNPEDNKIEQLINSVMQNPFMFKNLLRQVSFQQLALSTTEENLKTVVRDLIKAAQVPNSDLIRRPPSLGSMYKEYADLDNLKDRARLDIDSVFRSILPCPDERVPFYSNREIEDLDYESQTPNIHWPMGYDTGEKCPDAYMNCSSMGYAINRWAEQQHIGYIRVVTPEDLNNERLERLNASQVRQVMSVLAETVFEFKEEPMPPRFKSFPEQMEESKRNNSRYNGFNKRRKFGKK